MAQIVLADEINRATPKTQSALLEAMGEHQVTVEGTTRVLPNPFMVMATQNPIKYEGTFPLPKAKLDRFFMGISLGYPDVDQEVAIMDQREQADPINQIKSVCTQLKSLDSNQKPVTSISTRWLSSTLSILLKPPASILKQLWEYLPEPQLTL
ncbi:MAG: hypothetical protein CM1200mP39_20020 [Dehalococcoidia bacterium]|nr:MAG: hypothetical protein CM1200mP39_20020 [Dehalococcoidia bacterium]